MAAPVAAEELFDPDFLESLQHLRLVAKRVPRGGRFAEQRSKALGTGIEFQDFRPYSPGDDLRAVDWNLYRRLGKVFLRLFEELEDLPVYLLPDVSTSMWQEEPPRARAALRASMAFAAIALGQLDRVGVFPFAADLEVLVPPRSGWSSLPGFARRMERLGPGGPTDLARSLRRFGGMPLRNGLAVVISDFFDPRGVEAVVEALKTVRHRLLLVQVVRPSDRDPGVQGDLRLRDCESGERQDVTVTGAVLERYRAAYARFQSALAGFARRRHSGLLLLDADQPVVPQIASLFEAGRYQA
ncbi:MAG: DUF58 domain-containing protein [Planctomycetes bacterium]|nr:DUF58 domain-containing protein [Planctomycetota bacterium]